MTPLPPHSEATGVAVMTSVKKVVGEWRAAMERVTPAREGADLGHRRRNPRRASLSLRGNHTLSDQPRRCANSHPSLNAPRRLEDRRFAPAYCRRSGQHPPAGGDSDGSRSLRWLPGPLRFVASSQTSGDRSQLASAPCLGADAPREALQSASYSRRSYRSPLRTRIRRISTGPEPFSPPEKRKHQEQAQTQAKRKS